MTVYDPITPVLAVVAVILSPLILLARLLGIRSINAGMVPRE